VGGNLDIMDGRDRAIVRRAIASEWGISGDMMREVTAGLREAMANARANEDARAISSVAKVVKEIVGQIQADEHLDRKYDEASQGNAEAITRIVVEYGDDQAG